MFLYENLRDYLSFEKTYDPDPANNVNNRGEKSLAGLIGVPQLNSNEKISNPTWVTPIAKQIENYLTHRQT